MCPASCGGVAFGRLPPQAAFEGALGLENRRTGSWPARADCWPSPGTRATCRIGGIVFVDQVPELRQPGHVVGHGIELITVGDVEPATVREVSVSLSRSSTPAKRSTGNTARTMSS